MKYSLLKFFQFIWSYLFGTCVHDWSDWDDGESFGYLHWQQTRYCLTWRWGSVHQCIFKHDDKLYSWTYRTQPEEGIVAYDEEFECPEVEAYEKTVTAYRFVKPSEQA